MPQRETDHEDPADTAATPESASAPAAHPSSEPPENADLLVWMSWPLVSWAMPVLVYPLMLKGGGWEMLILLPFMILIVPGLALLGLLPRFILRRAGAKTSPTIVSIAMIVNWWSQVLIGMSHRGVGDSGGGSIHCSASCSTSAPRRSGPCGRPPCSSPWAAMWQPSWRRRCGQKPTAVC